MFRVAHRALLTPADDVTGGWYACRSGMSREFSAVAYFFARELHQRYDVPVGLIVNPWSAQPIEPFISRDGYERAGGFKKLLGDMDRLIEINAMTPEARKALHEEQIAALNARRDKGGHPYLAEDPGYLQKWFDPRTDASGWSTIEVPGRMESSGRDDLINYDGTVWFRYEADLPAAWAGQALTLNLCPVDDMDITYFNGTEVGRLEGSGGWNKPRSYKVPAEAVKAGKNVVVVRVVDNYLWGGLIDEPDQLQLVAPDGSSVSLAGEWRYRPGLRLASSDFPESTSSESIRSGYADGALQRYGGARGALCHARRHLVPGRKQCGSGLCLSPPDADARSRLA